MVPPPDAPDAAPASLPPAPEPVGPDRYRADVVVVGAGVAGLFAAIRLPAHLSVCIVDKGRAGGRSGSSPWAQGGMAAAMGPDDSPALHAADTIRAGDGLCDPAAVAVLAHEAPTRVRQLIDLGAEFDTDDASPDGTALHLAREGGQAVARSIHRADATGAEMVRALRTAAAPRVTRLEASVVALARTPTGRVGGVHVRPAGGGVATVEAAAVLLATGGCGGLFAATTNTDHATGDGVALAATAGAAVRDLEFVQFHPTGLAVTSTWRFLLTEALRGAGATLHDVDGHRFLTDVHPDAELAPRHVVARAILAQPGGAFLDATHLGEAALAHEFPTVLHGARELGFDLATQRVPVTPAAHYMVGGVRTDLDGRTSLAGLWAAGEVASTGVHGANRMAGNSLSEALVFGARAAESIAAELAAGAGPDGPLDAPPALAEPTAGAGDLDALRARLRETMWKGAGPVRDDAGLRWCLAELDAIADALGPRADHPDHVELTSAVTAARLVASSALLRTESRGGHVRDDHPATDPAWGDVHIERVLRPIA
ncbi:MAG: L-aspartate oxidase [Actinomycetes bacterium]